MIELILAVALLQEKVTTDKRCVECHEKQHDDWKESVHQKNAIGCVACHGPDEIGTGDKPHRRAKDFLAGTKKTSHLACVKCHEGVVQAFEKSAHWEDMRADEDSKVKSCLSCHTHHGTTLADRKAIVEQNCSKCHKPSSVQRKMADSYVAAAGALQEKTRLLKERLDHKVPGIPWKAEAEAFEEAERALKEARIEQHRVARGKKGGLKGLEDGLPAAAADADKAYNSLETKLKGAGKRPWWLAGFLGLLAVTLLLGRAWLVRWGHAA